MPFCPSSHLLRHGEAEAVAFSDRLVGSVQDLIENVHCFYVILPPAEPDTVRVGGLGCPSKHIPTWLFIKNLGPAFSYMTAHDYLYVNGDADVSGTEFHIDGFVSKETKSWEKLVGRVRPKVFWKGDECNPFIACADILAFLTDIKLRRRRLPLRRDSITDVWADHAFRTTVHYVDRKGITIHAWHSEESIDPWPYVARPTIFLSMDSMPRECGAEGADNVDAEGGPAAAARRALAEGGPAPGPADAEGGPAAASRRSAAQLRPSRILAGTPVYPAAVRYAFEHSASLKFFSPYEDFGNVRDRDAFVYVGPESKRIGEVLQDAVRLDIMSGLELRRRIEKVTKLPSSE